jgi:hypothetical protein
MKGSRMLFRLLVVASVTVGTLGAGTEILLYPLARAFGGPRESELVKCREGFRHFQADFANRAITVFPVLSRPDYSPANQSSAWSPDMAAALAAAIHRAARPGADPILRLQATAPAVPATKFGHNQMRYLWSRGAAYARHIQSGRPAGNYFLFTEIYAFGEYVSGIQVYVIDESGQIVYCRLFNSHHFGDHLPINGAYRQIARHLFQDLAKQAEEVFPPYGVG